MLLYDCVSMILYFHFSVECASVIVQSLRTSNVIISISMTVSLYHLRILFLPFAS